MFSFVKTGGITQSHDYLKDVFVNQKICDNCCNTGYKGVHTMPPLLSNCIALYGNLAILARFLFIHGITVASVYVGLKRHDTWTQHWYMKHFTITYV